MGFCRERLSASPALEHGPASTSKQQEARPGPQQQAADLEPEGPRISEPASDKENNEGAASDGMRPPALAPSLLGDLPLPAAHQGSPSLVADARQHCSVRPDAHAGP